MTGLQVIPEPSKQNGQALEIQNRLTNIYIPLKHNKLLWIAREENVLYFAPAEQKYNILHKILIRLLFGYFFCKKKNNLQNSWECMNRETKADKEQIIITSHTARKTNNNNMFSKLQ